MEILVDCENVGIEQWLSTVSVGKNDRVFLFYSSGVSATMHLDALSKILNSPTSRIAMVKCSAGKNSMDLCIASKCGELFNKERRPREYLIVSNDTGYDGFIKTCVEQGHKIKRNGTNTSLSSAQPSAAVPIPVAKAAPPQQQTVKLTKKQKKSIREYCKRIGLKDSTTDAVIQYIMTHGPDSSGLAKVLKKKDVKEGRIETFIAYMKKGLLPALA